MLKKIISLLFLFVFTVSVASAEKQEWIDHYDFSKVKTVFVCDPIIANHIKNGIKEKEIKKIFDVQIKLPDKITVITMTDLFALITADTGISPLDWYTLDHQTANKLFFDTMVKYSDLIVITQVLEYDIGKEYREGYIYTTTEYQNSYIYGRNGTTTVQTAVTKSHSVFDGNVQVAYAAVSFDVIDSKTQQHIISRIDDRARANPTIFDNTIPKDLYGQIMNSFFDTLGDKLK